MNGTLELGTSSGAAASGAGPESGDAKLFVVFTNDIHGGIDPTGATFMNREFPPPLGGGASAATYIEELRKRAAAEGGYVLLMDQGDIFQGTPVGNYRKGNWQEAVSAFGEVLKLNPSDRLAQVYIERCEHLAANPPADDWDGVWVMDTK